MSTQLSLRTLDYSKTDFVLLLVVKNAENTWLIHYQDVLKRELYEELKIWHIKEHVLKYFTEIYFG